MGGHPEHRSAHEGNRDQGRQDGGGALREPVGNDIPRFAFAAQPHGEGDRGVEMAARHMAASEDHDHEGGADGERGQGRAAAHTQADGEHEEKRADELDEIFFHREGRTGRNQTAE